jgi:hypothetical protein
MQTYLGSEPEIFEGLAEAFAKGQRRLDRLREPVFPESPVYSTPRKQKKICPYNSRIPTAVKMAVRSRIVLDEEELLSCKPALNWRLALRAAETLLEEANVKRMMRPCPATELARERAKQDWLQVKKAIKIARMNGVYYY